MKKYSKEINELATILKDTDLSTHEMLVEINKIQKNIETDAQNQKGYKLPYSSNPIPVGERWHTA